MNYRIIAYIVGWVFNLQAIFMVLPCIAAVIYQEEELYDSHHFMSCYRAVSYQKEAQEQSFLY